MIERNFVFQLIFNFLSSVFDKQNIDNSWTNIELNASSLEQLYKQKYEIKVSRNNSCKLDHKRNNLVCWGDLKDNINKIPKRIRSNILLISMGYKHICAILDQEKVLICWGNNEHSQLDVPEEFAKTVSVGAGNFHTCAVSTSGVFGCWGQEATRDELKLGILQVPDYSIGQRVVLVIGPYLNCIIKRVDKDGNDPSDEILSENNMYYLNLTQSQSLVKCWGDNKQGQTSLPPILDSPLASHLLKDLAPGMGHLCAIVDSRLVCWGDDSDRQASPPLNGGFRRILWVESSAGWFHHCGLAIGGLFLCWGDDTQGQTQAPRIMDHEGTWASGGLHNCMILNNRQIKCWGVNDLNQSNVTGVVSLR